MDLVPDLGLEYIDLQRRRLSQEHGMDITGGWTGTFCRRATGGKIH